MIALIESVFNHFDSWGFPVLIFALGIAEFSLGLYEKHWNKNERILDIVCYIAPFIIIGPAVAFFGLKFLPFLIPDLRGVFSWVPFFWGFIIIAIADDLTQYWYHRLHHEIPWLWRFHRTHHSAPYMGMAMASRQNIIYTFFFSQIYLTTILVYLGLGYPAIFVRVIKKLIVTFAHSSIAWDKPFYKYKFLHPVAWVLERTISTPATHHAHHASSTDDGIGYYKGNFGNMFFLWDVIFGTAHISRQFPKAYGISHYEGDPWYAQLAWPIFKSNIKGSELAADGPAVREDINEEEPDFIGMSNRLYGQARDIKLNRTIKNTTRMKFITLLALGISGSMYAQAQNYMQQQEAFKGIVDKNFADSREVKPQNVKAPQGAPNVLWILLDDVGFGATNTFGGVIKTPTFDSLANNGLRYTNFHTTGICAPTRAALMTGRNHHSVHMGGFAHTILSAGFPGYDGRIPSNTGTIAEIFRESGYNTFAVGKYGLTPDEDATDAGPFDRWPSGKGFDHFFGFLGSQTDQYKPDLVEDNAHVKPDGRHLNDQITDKAIAYIDRQQAAKSGKPFFLYYSPGATHAPHQVATEWSDPYKGKFDKGWDTFREEVFARQKKLGIIPANAVLPERNPNIKAWNTLSADEKKLYARFMEVYAGYLTYTDYEVGRVISHLKQINQLDNTLVFVVIGDNGASKEGTLNGDVDRTLFGRPLPEEENIKYNLSKIDLIGKPEGIEANYPLGWAQAANTPFKYWKQDANSEGGTRNPLIVFYPKGIKDKGTIRTQYGHVIDLLPTTLEYIGVKAPQEIRGIKQDSIQGTSLVYSFDNPKAASKHTEQYYYIFGSRAIYKDGWKAGFAFQPAISNGLFNKFSIYKTEDEGWALYNLNEDFNERSDLAKKNPKKLAELKALFDADAKKYNIYPFFTWDDVIKRVSAAR